MDKVNKTSLRSILAEITSSELTSVEKQADQELDPVDVQFTKHFFDRLNDPRNKKEITADELTSFFHKLAKKKEVLITFLKKYHEFVAKDRENSLNIPFVTTVNRVLAKTIMRKPEFMTTNPTLTVEEAEKIGVIEFPEGFQPAKSVPVGGSMCGNCAKWNKEKQLCEGEYYNKWHGNGKIPKQPTEYVCIWWVTKNK